MVSWRRALWLLGSVSLVGPAACKAPTALEVQVYTEIDCADDRDVALTTATSLAGLDGTPPSTTKSGCDVSRYVGNVVLTPDGDREGEVTFAISTRDDNALVEDCLLTDDREHCIIAKRKLRYVPGKVQVMRIDLRLACLGVVCPAEETCVQGQCVGAEIDGTCDGCDETSLIGSGSGGAGGGGPLDETPIPPGETVPIKLRAGYDHTCALYSNGGVKCWGDNQGGQLGNGTLDNLGDDPGEVVDESVPFVDLGGETAIDIGAGQFHSCALLGSGAVRCWGTNQAGSLGNDASGTFPTPQPFIMPAGRTAQRMWVQKRNVCVLYDDGSLRCSGQNDYGQLGIESFSSIGDAPGEMAALPPVDLGVTPPVDDLAIGDYHVCALISGGTVKCWGRGDYGRTGYGNTASVGGNPGDMGVGRPDLDLPGAATQLYRGWFGNCVLIDGQARCWGANINGEMGLGEGGSIGDRSDEMGSALPVLAPDEQVVAVHGGYHVWCIITEDRHLKCMGRNASGLLGQGSTENIGDEPGEDWGSIPYVDLGTGRILRGQKTDNVALGLAHTCALLDDFRIRCWGANNAGQLFVGDTDDRGDTPGEMGDALPSFRP